MGVRTRSLDMIAAMRREAADRGKRDDAARVVERWNKAIAAGRDIWWSPTIRAAIVAGMPWADVHCPGCQTSRSLDLRTIDRHPLASVGSLVLGLRCTCAATRRRCRRSPGCMPCRRCPGGRATYRRAINEWRCFGSAIANRGRSASPS
jgi:hypothetical protein